MHTAPPGSGEVVLGRSIPSLLDEAVERHPNERAFNQPAGDGWLTLSNAELQKRANEVAAGLLALDGIERGRHVAFFMHSDLWFTLADFGCLIAGVVNVPIYLTNPPETTTYVLNHSESKAVFVSDDALLAKLAPMLRGVPDVRHVILAEGTGAGVDLPGHVRLLTLDALREQGRAAISADPELPQRLRDQIDVNALATIIYTSGTTGQPKGVMLSHQNISSNLYTAFQGFGAIEYGNAEQTLTFLPMTHVFGRLMVFGHTLYGHPLYYSNPDLLVGHLPKVRPTVFATVPRVLEKVWDKVSLGVAEATGLKKAIGSWALGLASRYELGKAPGGLYARKLRLADKLVYSKLRERLGLDRAKFIVVGGAALRPELANAFAAMNITLIQGYGLTETSPVISFNRPKTNRAGSVGQPLAGIEVAIAEDGEILSRGVNTMLGYFKQPEETAAVIDADGWFHTGDIGEISEDGFLRITDRKKDLFKLSTGKYVMPTPVEAHLLKEVLIEQAVVLGSGRAYCTALIFPSEDALRAFARQNGLNADAPMEQLVKEPAVVEEFERLVKEANKEIPEAWSQVKRFRIVPAALTVENELLTPSMKVKRAKVTQTFERDIEALYATAAAEREGTKAVV
ncbi:MAG TPA: long-chain fatty acid--CoA ligase [Rubricoccaceae bacterium]|nr:long-chain fatty acid--CoA ligase [Rubricoccaceae bacterium]